MQKFSVKISLWNSEKNSQTKSRFSMYYKAMNVFCYWAVNVLRFSHVREYLENFKLEIRTKKTFGDLTSFTDLNGQNSVLTVAENDSAGNSHLRLTDPILILA